MADEPTLALQKAFKAALSASAAVAPKVLDHVPTPDLPPYIVLGDDQFIPDKAAGLFGGEIASNVHVYYAANLGRAGVKALVEPVVAALEDVSHDMGEDYAAHVTIHTGTTFQDGDDGKTTHAIVAFSTLFDTARDAA